MKKTTKINYASEPWWQWFLRTSYASRVSGASTLALYVFFKRTSGPVPVPASPHMVRALTPSFHPRGVPPNILDEYLMTYGFRALSYGLITFTLHDWRAYFREYGDGSLKAGIKKEICLNTITTVTATITGLGLRAGWAYWHGSHEWATVPANALAKEIFSHQVARITVDGFLIGIASLIQNKILFTFVPALKKPAHVYPVDPSASLTLQVIQELIASIDAGRAAALSVVLLDGFFDLTHQQDLLKFSFLNRIIVLLSVNQVLTAWRYLLKPNDLQNEAIDMTSRSHRIKEMAANLFNNVFPHAITVGTVLAVIALLPHEERDVKEEYSPRQEFLIHWAAMSLYPAAVKGVSYLCDTISSSYTTLWRKWQGYEKIEDTYAKYAKLGSDGCFIPKQSV